MGLEIGGSDLTGWVIALVGPRVLVGKRRGLDLAETFSGAVVVGPVYELFHGVAMGPARPVRTAELEPVAGFLSMVELSIPASAAVIYDANKLNSTERKWLLVKIRTAEDRIQKLKAEQAGITLAKGPLK